MKKMNLSVRNLASASFVFLCVSAFSLNAFAHMTCTSEWTKHGESDQHCHVKITKKNPDGEMGICSGTMPIASIQSEGACENFCKESDHGKMTEKLSDLLFTVAALKQVESQKLMKAVKTLQGELKLATMIAGDACFKKKKAKIMLQAISEATKQIGLELSLDGDEDDEEESAESSFKKSEAPSSMYN
jgi:hypothetical protein